jgi:hypothetical protein
MVSMRVLIAACVLLLAACAPATTNIPTPEPYPASESSGPTQTASPLLFSAAKGAKQVGGCGGTAVYDSEADPDAFPQSLTKASGSSIPRTPYAFARPATIAAFFFDYPLRLATPTIGYNKVLWFVGTTRTGPLEIDGHPLGATSPTVRYSIPIEPNYIGSGQLYGSQINAPSAGCWQFTLTWAGQRAEMEIEFAEAK